MGEINESLGIGNAFKIGDKEYSAHIATFEELEGIDAKTQGVYLNAQGMRFNFIKLSDEKDNKARDERTKKLLALLQVIFPDAPADSLKKLNRKEMANAIDYFLIS